MGFNLEKLEYDERRAEGVWVNQDGEIVETPNPNDLELLIAPLGTAKADHFQAKLLRRNQRFAREVRRGEMDPVKTEGVIIETIVHCALLGWRHMQIDGEEIPYSREKARELLFERRGFFKLVNELVSDETIFRERQEEEALGN